MEAADAGAGQGSGGQNGNLGSATAMHDRHSGAPAQRRCHCGDGIVGDSDEYQFGSIDCLLWVECLAIRNARGQFLRRCV